VQRGFEILDAANGEIWAKLEAGTEAYYKQVDRSAVPLSRVFENIRECAKKRAIVIQSMWMKLHGQLPPAEEFTAFLHRLRDLVDSGCRIKLVQLYTIARNTAESYATPLNAGELDALGAKLRAALPELAVEMYYGVG
jgi:wyosine [tRNA(Phe)-imidazoG37] synthetase (radical SAM superfamily)